MSAVSRTDKTSEVETWKVYIYGASETGKTTLARAFTEPSVDLGPRPLSTERLARMLMVDGQLCRIEIMDSLHYDEFGSQIFPRGARPSEDADGFIVMYSITDRSSFAQLERLGSMVQYIGARRTQRCPVVVVGNKCDMEFARQVSTEEGQSAAGDLPFLEMSGRTRKNVNVNEVLGMLVRQMRAATAPKIPQSPSRAVVRKRWDRCIVM
ncbi:P-loop containing nucleoside triphosphate hydrolase protein [Neolentinus lepideus HHB14362 ss-1]|uniref:small monomeric GTPase n=1 Tax=Neolentinus lepideus HHB14362 ss-1 TaxID=1314782 RepID=A0A165RXS4_9AGAM|nr:P-loop containing nucleoside triphosphate hydrolase protein [Neolentinus lepideus HHB14362 ss-1]